MDIDWLRSKIDGLDLQILDLINKRAQLALEIGKLKKAGGLPLFSPEREKELLEKLRNRNKGPLDDEAITRVYKKIIEEARTLQFETIENISR